MTQWVGLNKDSVYNGVLVVMNIDKYEKLPKDYLESVVGHISDAYADGSLVLYLFDTKKSVGETLDEFSVIEGSAIHSLSVPFGVSVFDFPLDPIKRTEIFKLMCSQLRSKFQITSRGPIRFCGSVKLDGNPVLLPLLTLN